MILKGAAFHRFSDKPMVKLQESPDYMPAGQTPHIVNIRSLYKTHIDLVHFRNTDYRYEQTPGLKARKGQELEELSKKQNISWEADQGSGAFRLGEWGREEENCDAGKHRFSILRS